MAVPDAHLTAARAVIESGHRVADAVHAQIVRVIDGPPADVPPHVWQAMLIEGGAAVADAAATHSDLVKAAAQSLR